MFSVNWVVAWVNWVKKKGCNLGKRLKNSLPESISFPKILFINTEYNIVEQFLIAQLEEVNPFIAKITPSSMYGIILNPNDESL